MYVWSQLHNAGCPSSLFELLSQNEMEAFAKLTLILWTKDLHSNKDITGHMFICYPNTFNTVKFSYSFWLGNRYNDHSKTEHNLVRKE